MAASSIIALVVNHPIIDPPYLRGEEIQRQTHWSRDVGCIIAAYAAHSLHERFDLLMHNSPGGIRILYPPCCYIDIRLCSTGYALALSRDGIGELCIRGRTAQDLTNMRVLPYTWPFTLLDVSQRDLALAAYTTRVSALLEPW